MKKSKDPCQPKLVIGDKEVVKNCKMLHQKFLNIISMHAIENGLDEDTVTTYAISVFARLTAAMIVDLQEPQNWVYGIEQAKNSIQMYFDLLMEEAKDDREETKNGKKNS
jgi:hypothetical protein